MDRSQKNNELTRPGISNLPAVYLFISILSVFITTSVFTQDIEWYSNFGSKGADAPKSLCIDDKGDIYVSGVFQYGVDVSSQKLTSSGSSDIFLLKLDSEGDHLWIKQYGGMEVENLVLNEYGKSVVYHKNHIYHAGIYDKKAVFGDTTLRSHGGYDIFLEKLSLNGNRQWIMSIGSGGHDCIEKMATDHEGNIYLTGFFLKNAFIGDFTFEHKSCPKYILKLDPDGQVIWINHLDGSVFGKEILVDPEGNVFWFCNFKRELEVGNNTLLAKGSQDLCMIKYDKNGNLLWSKGMNGKGYDEVGAACLGDDGNIYLAGTYQQELEIDNITLRSKGMQDAFLLKMDAMGNALWARSAGGGLNDNGVCVEQSAMGNIVLGGMFSDEAIFDSDTLATNQYFDIFFAIYTPDGSVLSVKPIGGNSQDKLTDFEIDSKGALVFAAKFSKEMQSDKGDFKSQGYEDVLIGKIDLQEEFLSSNAMDPLNGEDLRFDIIPNPAHDGYAYIYCNKDSFISEQIELISSSGKTILTHTSVTFPHKIDISGLEKGMYFIKIYSQESAITKKIIIQ